MLTEHEIFKIEGAGGSPLHLEVNWNALDEETNNCKKVKVVYPDNTSVVLNFDNLLASVFAMGKQEDQPGMVPHKIQSIRNYETMLGITASKDIKKGDKLNVRVKIPLPLTQEQLVILGKTGQLGKDLVKT